MHQPNRRRYFGGFIRAASAAGAVLVCPAGALRADTPDGADTVRTVSVVVGGYEAIRVDTSTLFCFGGSDITRAGGTRPANSAPGSYAAAADERVRFPLVVRYTMVNGSRADRILETVSGTQVFLVDPSPLTDWVFPNCRPAATDFRLWADMLTFGGRKGREGTSALVAEWSAWEAGGRRSRARLLATHQCHKDSPL